MGLVIVAHNIVERLSGHVGQGKRVVKTGNVAKRILTMRSLTSHGSECNIPDARAGVENGWGIVYKTSEEYYILS